MKDPRFLPVDLREPVEEYEDDFSGSDEDIIEMLALGNDKHSVRRMQLYIAS